MLNINLFNFNSHEIRTIHKNNMVWFVASDIATALEYRDSSNLTRILDPDESDTHIMSIRSENEITQDRTVLLINESGLYHALFKSRKKEAQAFRKWVTNEVLPSIRNTGSYSKKKHLPITEAPVDISGAVLAYDLASEIGAEVSRSAYKSILMCNDEWRSGRWLVSFDKTDNRNLEIRKLRYNQMVFSIDELADVLANTGDIPVTNNQLLELAIACNTILNRRLEK